MGPKTDQYRNVRPAPHDGSTRVEAMQPGDWFDARGSQHVVRKVQVVSRDRTVLVTTAEPVGEPVEMVGLDGAPIVHRPLRILRFPLGHFLDAVTLAERSALAAALSIDPEPTA